MIEDVQIHCYIGSMTCEISELSVANRNNQIFQDVSVRRPSSADKALSQIRIWDRTSHHLHLA